MRRSRFFLRTMLPAGNLLLLCWLGASKPALADRELSLNLFRSPSIGAEYREAFLGLHGGFYPTVISRDAQGHTETTWFLKFGATGHLGRFALGGDAPSAFFTSVSYVRGLNHGWGNGALLDAGFRWVPWLGLNLRLGGGLLLSPDHSVRLNPTPGVGWNFPLRQ